MLLPRIAGMMAAMLDSPRLTPLDIVLAAIGLLLVSTLLTGPDVRPVSAASTTIDTRAVITVTEEPSTSHPSAGRAFAGWQDRAVYNGAFAVAKNGAYGWVEGYNSAALARSSALAHCAEHGSDCRIIATTTAATEGPDGLSLTAANRQRYVDHLARPGYAAWAISPNGATGWAASYSTGFAARARALAECEGARARQPEFLPPAPCRIVSVRRPWD